MNIWKNKEQPKTQYYSNIMLLEQNLFVNFEAFDTYCKLLKEYANLQDTMSKNLKTISNKLQKEILDKTELDLREFDLYENFDSFLRIESAQTDQLAINTLENIDELKTERDKIGGTNMKYFIEQLKQMEDVFNMVYKKGHKLTQKQEYLTLNNTSTKTQKVTIDQKEYNLEDITKN